VYWEPFSTSDASLFLNYIFHTYRHTYIKNIYITHIILQLESLCTAVAEQKIFSCHLKVANDNPGCRRQGGRSFQTCGPAAEKLLSPNLLWVPATTNIRMSLELDRSGRRPASDSRLQSCDVIMLAKKCWLDIYDHVMMFAGVQPVALNLSQTARGRVPMLPYVIPSALSAHSSASTVSAKQGTAVKL